MQKALTGTKVLPQAQTYSPHFDPDQSGLKK